MLPRKKKIKTECREEQNCEGKADWYEMVQKKAYELYEQRGSNYGHDWDDWYEAERFVKSQL